MKQTKGERAEKKKAEGKKRAGSRKASGRPASGTTGKAGVARSCGGSAGEQWELQKLSKADLYQRACEQDLPRRPVDDEREELIDGRCHIIGCVGL